MDTLTIHALIKVVPSYPCALAPSHSCALTPLRPTSHLVKLSLPDIYRPHPKDGESNVFSLFVCPPGDQGYPTASCPWSVMGVPLASGPRSCPGGTLGLWSKVLSGQDTPRSRRRTFLLIIDNSVRLSVS